MLNHVHLLTICTLLNHVSMLRQDAKIYKAYFSVFCMIFPKSSNKSHNMKALIILTYLFKWKKWTFVVPCTPFWSIFVRKKLPLFQKNLSVMRHLYKIIIVQYNETWWDWCSLTNWYTKYTFEGFFELFLEKRKKL